MIQTLETPTPGPAANNWGNTSVAFGSTAMLLSWIPWIGMLGVLLAAGGIGFAMLGLARNRRTAALIGLLLSTLAIAVPVVLYV